MGKKKLSLDFIKESFEKENYICLDEVYVNAHHKIKYICPNKHKHEISWNKWQQGKRCPYCAGNSKKTVEEVRYSFKSEGYKLLSGVYLNNEQKLNYECPNGHHHSMSWGAWVSGNRCVFCSGLSKPTLEKVRNIFAAEGFTLLSNEYKNTKSKLKYRCPVGHKHAMSLSSFKKGIRCPYCSGKAKKRIDFLKREFEKENYILLDSEYKNVHSDLNFICPNDHKDKISWNLWRRCSRCPTCAGKRIDTKYAKDSFYIDGYVLLSKYEKSNKYLYYICPNGHKGRMRWYNWKAGKRCPKCAKQQSKNEAEISNFLQKYVNVIERDRTLIAPYELDIVIPDQNIAIEYCGLYWHSELAGKDRNYHLNKLKLCNNKGYKLITIFEDEFIKNKNIVFSRIVNMLGANQSKKVYARNCIIKEISISEAKSFCIENHLQGYVGSNIKLGAFYKNRLVSVMTFSKPNISKGHKKYLDLVWELSRFCSHKDIRVVGIASKLLKHFKKNYRWDRIFSYADRRWSNGNLYKQLEFRFVGNTPPNYWYFKGMNRLHRFALRKKENDFTDQTEWQLRQSQGWNRIWDCGNLKFEIGGLSK